MLMRWGVTAAIAAAFFFGGLASAHALQADPTMGLARLQEKMDAAPDGVIDGYFKTVIIGSRIETIPVRVLAITAEDPSRSFILFEASGPQIAKFGGIAAGMSGSPIYVDDDGVDTVIGAVAYGDMFTLGGTGLATPIEPMLDLLEGLDAPGPTAIPLAEPVEASGRVIEQVLVSADPLKVETPAGTFVARPLAAAYIGGLDADSLAYKRVERSLKARGMAVVQLGAPLSSDPSTFETTLRPGAAVAALSAYGDMWIGSMGTVTYSNGSALVAFGHSYDNAGDTDLFMCNALMNGVWPSSFWPYKMGRPAAVRGSIVKDRRAGIVGVMGEIPTQTPVTARVTDVATGRQATSTVYMSSELLDDRQLDWYCGAAASVAGVNLYDSVSFPGSANTTITIQLTDGTDDYTVVIPNLIDSDDDITDYASWDVYGAVESLLWVQEYGLEKAHIVSIDFEAAMTRQRRSANILAVTCPSALKSGENIVEVALRVRGIAATQTIETTVNIPAGTPLTGSLSAASVDSYDYDDEDEEDPDDPSYYDYAPPTVEDMVEALNGMQSNNEIVVTFSPSTKGALGAIDDDEDDEDGPSSLPTVTPEPKDIEKTVETAWSVSGEAETAAANMTVIVRPNPVTCGSYSVLMGMITGPSREATVVYVYGISALDPQERLIATGTITTEDDMTLYTVLLRDVTCNTTLRVHVPGDMETTPLDNFSSLQVRAKVSARSSSRSITYGKKVTLSAAVSPAAADGTVRFEYYNASRRRWVAIGTRALTSDGTLARASLSWRPPKGSIKVRCVYAGGVTNAPATTAAFVIKVK